MAGKELKLDVVGNLDMRRGAYANALFISSQPSEDILDFYFMDGSTDEGGQSGILAARVVMSRATLRSVKDAIEAHLSQGPENA